MSMTMDVGTMKTSKSGDTQVAALSRSRRLHCSTRSLRSTTPKTSPGGLPPSAADRAACQMMKEDSRPRDEAECLTVFNPVADLSTYRTKKSVRTTRATPRCGPPTSPTSASSTVLCTWRSYWTCSPGASSVGRYPSTSMPSWRSPRCARRSRHANRQPGASITRTAACNPGSTGRRNEDSGHILLPKSS